MKVGIITSWGTRCGIAEYSRDFLEAIKGKADPYIIPIDVALDFSRFKFIVKEFSNPDALIFMFEHGLTKGFEPFKNWVLKFHSLIQHPKLFVLAHQVSEGDNWKSLVTPPDIKVDGVIVHSKHMLDWAYVIPHPCKVYPEIKKEQARSKLELEEYHPIISTFGFPFPHKRFDIIIEAFRKVQAKYPNALLIMLCSRWRDESATAMEEAKLKKLASNLNVLYINDKYEVDEFMPYLFASDIYVTSQEEKDRKIISGSALMGVTARRPIITNTSTIYKQIHPYALIVPKGNPEMLAKRIIDLVENPELYDYYARLSREAYETFNWNVQINNFLKIFYEHYWKCFKLRDAPPPSYYLHEQPMVADWQYKSASQQARIKWIQSNVPKGFLEVGCSTGHVLKTCGGKCGIDISRRRLSVAKKLNVALASATHLPFPDKSFPAVLLPEILEHFEPFEAVKVIKEALRVGKEVYFTIPNMETVNQYKGDPDVDYFLVSPEHLWFVSEQSLNELFRMAGCKIQYQKVHAFFCGKVLDSVQQNSLKAVILAAGYSTRMKRNKHTLKLCNETVIQRQIRLLRKNGIEDIAVVVRPDDEELNRILDQEKVRKIHTFTDHKDAFKELIATLPYLNLDTLILLGDLVYTDKALKKMIETKEHGITVFGVTEPTKWCNKEWAKPHWHGEIFAVKLSGFYVRLAETLFKAMPNKYYDLWNIPLQLNLPIQQVEECLDIDNEIDYETAKRLMLQYEHIRG